MSVQCIASTLYKTLHAATCGFLPTILAGASSSIWLLGRSVPIHQLFSYATETAEGLNRDPPKVCAGVLLNLTFGHTLTVQVAAKTVLVACKIIEVTDTYNAFKRAWKDLAAIKEKVPITFIQHYVKSLESSEQTLSTDLIRRSPKPLAACFVKCIDAAYLIKNFVKAFFAMFEASIKFYYAIHIDEPTRIYEQTNFFRNVDTLYTRFCNNPHHAVEAIQNHSTTINKILSATSSTFRSEDLIRLLKPKESSNTTPSTTRTVTEVGREVARFSAFACTQAFAGVTRHFGQTNTLPAPQPILHQGPSHANNSTPHASCKTGEESRLRRYYKTSERRGESCPT